MEIIERIIFKLLGGDAIEKKLIRCQSYRPGSTPKWKSQTSLNWPQTLKFLKAIEIFDAQRIRHVIHDIASHNTELFNRSNLFITAFGSQGKSGGKIAYEFKHTALTSTKKYVEGWDLSRLPENSTIIFVEDIIGTGTQSTAFILEKLNLLLNPSHIPFLLTICATPQGIKKIEDETNFQVITGVELKEELYQHFSAKNKYFTENEKRKLYLLNDLLKNRLKEDFDLGLLIAFYYSPPNNSMPILWKENYNYQNKNGLSKKWFALIPRQY